MRGAVSDDAVLRVRRRGCSTTEHLAAVQAAVGCASSWSPEMVDLAKHAARTGEPILRPLAYHHPGYEHVHDQFLLGEDILAAPVLEQGATTRRVVLPPGPLDGGRRDDVRRTG